MKLRQGESWMPADDYGRSLKGLGINPDTPIGD